jgi:hypothetical protein
VKITGGGGPNVGVGVIIIGPGVGVGTIGVGVGGIVGVGVGGGHKPINTTSICAPYSSTITFFAQKLMLCNGRIELTLIMSVHPVHL